MLEGLDITELQLTAVRAQNDKLRIDSGYFAKPMLEAERLVRGYAGGYDELGPLFSRFVKGIFDINAEAYSETGVPFLRILNLRYGVVDDTDLALIPEAIHEAERKTELRRGDIVLSKTAYPAASLVTLERCNTSQDTIATTLSDYGRKNYRPEAIVAFLNGSLGSRLLLRQFQGNVQLHLSLDDGRKVPVPRLTRALQESISTTFTIAHAAAADAVRATELAEQSLGRELGIDGRRASGPYNYTRASRDAFDAGRLDAEFFAPRVSELLRSLQRDGLTIGAVAPARYERFVPTANGDFQYIEIGSISSDGTARHGASRSGAACGCPEPCHRFGACW